ncbi:MAG: hypothetical protein WDM92_15060 [Caulobacteraceae bacterium]
MDDLGLPVGPGPGRARPQRRDPAALKAAVESGPHPAADAQAIA